MDMKSSYENTIYIYFYCNAGYFKEVEGGVNGESLNFSLEAIRWTENFPVSAAAVTPCYLDQSKTSSLAISSPSTSEGIQTNLIFLVTALNIALITNMSPPRAFFWTLWAHLILIQIQ